MLDYQIRNNNKILMESFKHSNFCILHSLYFYFLNVIRTLMPRWGQAWTPCGPDKGGQLRRSSISSSSMVSFIPIGLFLSPFPFLVLSFSLRSVFVDHRLEFGFLLIGEHGVDICEQLCPDVR